MADDQLQWEQHCQEEEREARDVAEALLDEGEYSNRTQEEASSGTEGGIHRGRQSGGGRRPCAFPPFSCSCDLSLVLVSGFFCVFLSFVVSVFHSLHVVLSFILSVLFKGEVSKKLNRHQKEIK